MTTPSGLIYTSVVEGKGASPTAADTVKVHYRGTFPDGTRVRQLVFAQRAGDLPARPRHPVLDRGRAEDEGRRQGPARLPAGIAYGERGAGNGAIPPNATLRFEVELLEINPR